MREEGDVEETAPLHAEAALHRRLGDALREGFIVVREAELDDQERRRWERRLIAVSTTAKRDPHRAQEQYARFLADLRRAVPASPHNEDR
jgi:hypothetical protein